jgi:hypothetical protein
LTTRPGSALAAAAVAAALAQSATPAAAATTQSCPNVRGAEVIGATNLSCRSARKLARVWVAAVRRDGRYDRDLFGFRCRNRPSRYEGDTIVCTKGRRKAAWYVSACWAASAGASDGSFVSVNAGGAELRRRPRAMHLVSNENLVRIRWSSWGGPAATGRATSVANAPSPGHRSRNPVRVRLSGRRSCDGVRVYTSVRVSFTRGVPYHGQPWAVRYRFDCPAGG